MYTDQSIRIGLVVIKKKLDPLSNQDDTKPHHFALDLRG